MRWTKSSVPFILTMYVVHSKLCNSNEQLFSRILQVEGNLISYCVILYLSALFYLLLLYFDYDICVWSNVFIIFWVQNFFLIRNLRELFKKILTEILKFITITVDLPQLRDCFTFYGDLCIQLNAFHNRWKKLCTFVFSLCSLVFVFKMFYWFWYGIFC